MQFPSIQGDNLAHLSCVVTVCSLLLSSFLDSGEDVAVYSANFSFIVFVVYYVLADTYRLDVHWRTIPFFSFTLCLLLFFKRYRWTDVTSYALCLYFVVSLSTAIILNLFPVYPQASLHGRYKNIGTYSFNLKVTKANGESDTDDKESSKTFAGSPVQCWFPMKEGSMSLFEEYSRLWTSGNPADQLRESIYLLDILAKSNGIPSFAMKHIALVRTNSIWQKTLRNLAECLQNSPKAVERSEERHRFPIALYSHGLYGWRQSHTSACERLASMGYVVFSLDHFPDATATRPYGNLSGGSNFDFRPPEGVTLDEDRRFYTEGIERRNRQLSLLIQHILSECKETPSSEFYGKLDPDKLVVWGHSYGGGTVGSLMSRDNRIKAGVLLDSWCYPLPDEDRLRGCIAPLLLLSSTLWSYGKYQGPYREEFMKTTLARKELLGEKANASTHVVFEGSNHQNFCDTHLLCHQYLLSGENLMGPKLNKKLVIDLIDATMIGFFNSVLFSAPQKSDGYNGDQRHIYSDSSSSEASNKSAIDKEVISYIAHYFAESGEGAVDGSAPQLDVFGYTYNSNCNFSKCAAVARKLARSVGDVSDFCDSKYYDLTSRTSESVVPETH